MDIFELFQDHLSDIMDQLAADKVLPEDAPRHAVIVEPPRDSGHGDLSTNAAMVLAKAAKQPPRDLAQTIAEKLGALEIVKSADVAGPGFINLRLDDAFWGGIVKAVLADPEGYGRPDLGKGEKLNVEYVSANPTGPMHVGHCRGAVFGDALAR